MTATDPTPLSAVGLPTTADFHEPDERPDDVAAAFELGERGVTAPPPLTVEASGVELGEPTGGRTATTPAPAVHASGPRAGQPVEAERIPDWERELMRRQEAEDAEDALCRRVWAGALRYGAAHLATIGLSRGPDALRDLADHIDAGALTPWADQPEPGRGCPADAFLADPPERQLAEWERELAVSQSVPAGDATAAAGPTPATPGAAERSTAILGRALLGARVWREDLAPGTGLWSCGDGNWFKREVVEDGERGLVREVLLVDPSVARVLDAAQVLDGAAHSVWLHGDWRWFTSKMTTGQREAFSDAVDRYRVRLNAADGELGTVAVERWWRAAAVDALGEPAPDDQRRCTVTHPAHGQCELYQGHRTADTDPDCRHRTGALLWLTDAEIRACALPPLASYAGTADLQSGPANASGPAGGPGWDRDAIDAIIAGWDLRGVSDGSQETLTALVADAEAGQYAEGAYQRAAARHQRALEERDAARAELAVVVADRESHRVASSRLAVRLAGATGDVERLCAEVGRLEEELVGVRSAITDATGNDGSMSDVQAIADLRRRRDVAVDETFEIVEAFGLDWSQPLPAQLRDQLATVRRDAAADALDYGARWIRQVFADGIDPEVAKCLDALAVTTRNGSRPVPGSPQPDGGGNDAG
jgi:hypothetical protein